MGGRFGKYGDAKRRAQMRRTRRQAHAALSRIDKKKSSKDSKLVRRRHA